MIDEVYILHRSWSANVGRDRASLAKPKMVRALDARGRVLRHADLREVLKQNHSSWRLPQDFGLTAFRRFLIERAELRKVVLPLPHRPETMYLLGEVPSLVVALAAKPGGYLSHFTAMGIHELTTQQSKTIYVNVEQRPQPSNPGSLTQENIDRAFRGQQRRTTNFAEYNGHRLMYLNGRHTGGLGVIGQSLNSGDIVAVTDLERTLIDIAVRPAYSGGVSEVLGAYRTAASRLSVGRIVAMLSSMKMVYPYEQAIGFYLQRAGVDSGELGQLRRKPFRFDYYLAHGMRELVHIPEWRLYIPKGL